MQLHFDNAWVLFFIWIVPAIVAWWLAIHKRSIRAMAAFVDPALQRKLFPKQNPQRQLWQIALVGTGILLLLVAAARPKWGEREETVYQQSRDLVIAVDVSRSMLANDVHPTRLRRAKIDLVDLITELRGDRAALIAFRAKASLVCPLTTDYAFLRQALDGISPASAPRGETDIGTAIEKALDAFEEGDASHKAIILISDGEDLTGKAKEVAQKAGEQQIPIYTVGIGSRQGSRIPNQDHQTHYLQHKDKDIVTKLDHETLYAIAKASGGSYIPVETASMTSTTLGTLYRDHLRKINARELAETRETRAIERYQWLLFPALCFLFAASALSRGRIASGKQAEEKTPSAPLRDMFQPKRKLKQLSILFLLGTSLITYAQSTTNALPTLPQSSSTNAVAQPATAENTSVPAGRHGARTAQRLFKQGKFNEAADAYLQAAQGVSRQASRDFRHNAAVAFAKAGDFERAAEIFQELSLQARRGESDENLELGSALYRTAEALDANDADQAQERADQFRAAAEAFKESWRQQEKVPGPRDNVAIAVTRLAEAQEQAKSLALTKAYEKVPAPQLADQMLTEQRAIATALPSAITNTSPDRIAQLEALAERQKALAELWIPLKGKLTGAMAQQPNAASNAQHFAAFTQLMDATQEEMQEGGHKLRDLDAEGFRSSKVAEHNTYQLWKTIAPHDMLLREDIRQQTNVIGRVEGTIPDDAYSDPLDIQKEATGLTELFKQRFEQAVPEKGTTPPPESTPPQNGTSSEQKQPEGISAETRAEILRLAQEAIEDQKLATDHIQKGDKTAALKSQRTGYSKLSKIQELLPKQQNQQQQNQKDKQGQKDQQQNQKQDQQQQQENQEQNAEKKDEKQSQQESKPKEDQEEKDLRKLLEKALEREREHEAEKRRRKDLIPLPAFERDW